jgi:O-antigen ligase
VRTSLIVALTAGQAKFGARLRGIVAIGVTVFALMLAFALVDVGAVAQAAGRLSIATLVVVMLVLLCGALLACVRLACIASDLGYRMGASDAIAALSLGQLAGAIFFQLVGQLIARSAVLARRGVPVAGTVAMTGYERLVALAVSLALAVMGGWYLFGKITLDLDAGGAMFLKLAAGGTIAIVASGFLAWGRPACAFVRANMGPGAVWRLGRSLALSLCIQACTMAAYVAAVAELSPNTDMVQIAAASAVVMLAASVPVSLAGWGVRELGAIYALGAIGVDRETALVVAILIGAAALGVVAILAAVAALTRVVPRPPVLSLSTARFDVPVILAWAVPVLAAIAVFFQVHVPLSGSRLNVNLADPLVITAAVLFALDRIKARQLPIWRPPLLNAHLAIMTAIILIAFVHGWIDFGITPWALTNRLAGWFVLLAYMATGALIISRTANAGFSVLLRTYAAVALGIIALDVVIFAATRIGLRVPAELVTYRIEGFAQNANAFALQIMLAIAAIFATIQGPRIQTLGLGVAFIGLWFSGSRSGLIALAVVVLAALALRAVKLSRVSGAAILTLAAIVFVDWLPEIVMATAGAAQWGINGAQSIAMAVADLFTTSGTGTGGSWAGPALVVLSPPQFSPFGIVASGYEPSNVQRIASLHGGLDMFVGNPIFGAGLGAFIESYTRAHGVPLVIHSTPLWLLAELGIVGLCAFAAPFIGALKYETYEASPTDPTRTFIILALLAFAAIAAVHDMMYQRAFWLLIGAALAHGAKARVHN